MFSTIPIKKLFKTALYTSPLIGAIAVAPDTIIKPPDAVIKSVPVIELFTGIALITLFVLFIWALNIALVYFTEKKSRRKLPVYLRYILSYIICFTLMGIAIVLIKPPLPHEREAEHFLRNNPETMFSIGRLLAPLLLCFVLNTIVLIIQDLILLREKKAMIEFEYAQLKIKNIEATNQQLKQQIHPHFLFNSLNTLKTLIRKHPDKAEDYLIKLSDFLRASISSDAPNTVKLSDEIKLCLDYLEMQKMRFGEALQYSINIPEEIQNSGLVPVFSLLPLLENAIKHNILTSEMPLLIKTGYENGRIITTNNIQPKLTTESTTGLGLENLSERYKILSGDEIIITKTNKIFSVSIKILDNENSNHRG
ncbi:MAG: histidine kinase [Bacteroidia bacterium]|nr:histidine kinase [Bacteroidia bacterium]